MKWIIDEQLIKRLGKKVKRRDRKERAFVLIGSRSEDTVYVRSFVSVVNRADDPMNNFVVVSDDVARGIRDKAVGVAHSHTWRHPMHPSENDYDKLPEDQIGLVLHSTERMVIVYDRTGVLLARPINRSRRT